MYAFRRFFSCRGLCLVFVLHLLVALRPEHRCLGLVSVPPNVITDLECRPADIQLYTWSGPGFEPGQCWHEGNRFKNGEIWGRMDIPGAPYCICDQGNIRIFYSQQMPKKPVSADSLTLLRPVHGSSPTPNDLAKWPVSDLPIIRRRTMICSSNQLGRRVRSRDGCIGCKCSKNGHWLCRKPPLLIKNRTITISQRPGQQQPKIRRSNRYSSNGSSNSVNVKHHVATTSRTQPHCPTGTKPQFCVLIERLSSTNASEKSSRYVEIIRDTSWTDFGACTRCSCTSNGRLTCEFLHATCTRPCLVQKTLPVSVLYYFPSGSKWLTPPHDKCRSCICVNGQRRCINCDQVLRIDIDASRMLKNDHQQHQSSIGEFNLLPSMNIPIKIVPCVVQMSSNSHRLILPGQQTWFENRCYFCSKAGGRLIFC